MRVVPLDRPWKEHQPLLVFDFLSSVCNFWKDFIQKWIQTPAFSDHGLYMHKPRSFPPNRVPKMPESQQLQHIYLSSWQHVKATGIFANRDTDRRIILNIWWLMPLFLNLFVFWFQTVV
jgi:hypothetical protein